MDWSKFFICDPCDGILYWKRKPFFGYPASKNDKSWNERYAGRPAGSKRCDGYIAIDISVLKKKFKAHRVVWDLFRGEVPDGYMVDHMNRDKGDNRLDNLRLVSRRENLLNSERFDEGYRLIRKPTVSKSKGKRAVLTPWIARIVVNGENIRIGSYPTEEKAKDAYLAAVAKYRPN